MCRNLESMKVWNTHKELRKSWYGHGKFRQTSISNKNKHTIATDKQSELHSCLRIWKRNTQTWKEKARSAGIGIRAAMKNAVTLLMEVKATLAPVLFRHSPVRSWGRKKNVIKSTARILFLPLSCTKHISFSSPFSTFSQTLRTKLAVFAIAIVHKWLWYDWLTY